ncbi:hypothetical protein [Escherichia phage dw-ec]|nr:hypothetical protein [Escherichia phage dw-ec]
MLMTMLLFGLSLRFLIVLRMAQIYQRMNL